MKITSVKAIQPYTIRIQYEDGVEGGYTIIPKSDRDSFHKLSNRDYMSQVHINKYHNAILWDEENDIDGMFLYEHIKQKCHQP